MREARVAIFEDHEGWHDLLVEDMQDNGHHVVAAAKSIEEAREVIDSLEAGSVDVAVVDGNLTPDIHSGADGAEITQLLRDKVGELMIIGCSADEDVIRGVDKSVRKIDDDPGAIILTVIREL